MSRVLPFKKPTWDYSLWNEVRSKAATITEEDVKYLSRRDRGGSAKSNFWQKGGRRRNRDDSTKVIDFVGLSRDFDGWFTRVDLGRDGLLEEFQSKIDHEQLSNYCIISAKESYGIDTFLKTCEDIINLNTQEFSLFFRSPIAVFSQY